MRLSARALELKPSGILSVSDMTKQASPEDALAPIDLAEGDPDFATPDFIVDSAVDALHAGETHYVASRGIEGLRRALISRTAAFSEAGYDPARNVIISPGAKFALYASLMCLVDPGDAVIVIDPAWVSFDAMIRLAGGVPIRVPTSRESRFFPDLEELGARSPGNAKALIVNSPNNPTGRIYTRAELLALLEWAAERDLAIISDEVYESMAFDRPYVSVAEFPQFRDRVLVVGGFSKSYAMTGWRLGYCVGPERILERMVSFQQHTVSCVPGFAQQAAVTALESPSSADAVASMAESYRQRRDVVRRWVAEVPGLEMGEPEGSFFAWVDVSRVNKSSEAFASRLYEECRVAVTPGVAFGECGEGYVRLCYGREPMARLKEGLARIEERVRTWRQ